MADSKRPRKAPAKKATPAAAKKATPPKTPKKAPVKAPAKKAAPRKATAKPIDAEPDNVVQFRRGAGRSAGETTKRPNNTGAKTSPKAISVAERRQYVVALRRMGASFVQIAEQVRAEPEKWGVGDEYDNKRAWEDVRTSIDRHVRSEVQDYLDESIDRLNFAAMQAMKRLTSDKTWHEAGKLLVAIERRRAALLGLDAAKRVQVSGTDGGPIQFSVDVTDPESSYEAAERALNEILGPPREIEK